MPMPPGSTTKGRSASPRPALFIPDVMQWRARKPDAVCLASGRDTWTWDEFTQRWLKVAAALQAAGVAAGDRILYLGRNRPEYFELLLGAGHAGVVAGAVNWRFTAAELAAVFRMSQPKMLVTTEEFRAVATTAVALARLDPIVLVLDSARAADDFGSWRDAPNGPPAGVLRAPEDPFMHMFTSGTTGAPKAVVHSHRSIAATVQQSPEFNITEATVTLALMPVFHAIGVLSALQVLARGGRVVIGDSAEPVSLLDTVQSHRITLLPIVPAVLGGIVEELATRQWDVSSLDRILYAGSPITARLLAACLGVLRCDLTQVYGMTETLGATMLSPADHLDSLHPERLGSCGKPMSGVALRIVDPVSGLDVDPGQTGEIWIASGTLLSGYWDAPVATAELRTPDGWVRSGDGGYLRDGYIYLRDRVKDMIVSGGENIHPLEIENVLSRHPGIAEVAVVGLPSARWGETVTAFVVRRPARAGADPLDEQQVIDFARGHLAHYKCPTCVRFVESLPRNATGKVLKARLRSGDE